jgi:uncharacterized protein (DUF2062 family)
MSSAPVAPDPSPPSTPGFWQRRVVQPIRSQLTQGVSPDQIAATIAVGTACSLFPIFGVTSIVNLAVGLPLRMNQPILQAWNQLLGPLQIALILAYVRLGEVIWRSTENKFTLTEMLREFRERSLVEFLNHFGWAGVHALTAWVLTSPLLVALVYVAVRPILRRAAKPKRTR